MRAFASPSHARVAAALARRTKSAAFAAIVLHAVLLVECLDHPRILLEMSGAVIAVTVFNVWLNKFMGRRMSIETLETFRLAGNTLFTLTIGIGTHWSLPVWFFLPFIAVVGEEFDSYAGVRVLVHSMVVSDVALASGVHLLYPASFTALAFACYQVASSKTRAIREMLDESDVQRVELERARSELAEANERIREDMTILSKAEIELRQAQKLEAVGRLASGIAHEINTPVQFVGDSIHFLRGASEDMLKLLRGRKKILETAPPGAVDAGILSAIEQLEEELDVGYLIENFPLAIERATEGLGRVTAIVRSMKEFAHPDKKTKSLVDLNRAIQATVTIARNEYKYVADLETNLGEMPPVLCFAGELNQALLNLVVNAAHAIGDLNAKTGERGLIRVTSRREGDDVIIEVEDTGGGIPPEVQEHIFEPFFTTKEVGRGTGQGLALARSIAERHSGKISFETDVGKGTTFTVRIPIARADDSAEEAA